jgi:UDP-2,3-diacylglucosamine pyrophosphatase LpxH
MKIHGDQFCLESKIAQSLNSLQMQSSKKTFSDKTKLFFIKLAHYYASLHSDNSYRSLGNLFINNAIQRFKQNKTIVTFGHSHQREIKYFKNNNIYINTSFFSRLNNYSTTVFSTTDGQVAVIKNL